MTCRAYSSYPSGARRLFNSETELARGKLGNSTCINPFDRKIDNNFRMRNSFISEESIDFALVFIVVTNLVHAIGNIRAKCSSPATARVFCERLLNF